MKNFLKHVGLVIAGGACVVAGIFFPPAAPVLGVLGTKLLLAGGGTAALALASPEKLKAGFAAITGRV